MKVVQLINGLGRGGAERMLVELVRELRSEVDFEVYCLTRGGPLEAELGELGVPVVHLSREGRPRPRAWARFVLAVRDADVLHTHLLYSDMVGASLRQSGIARRWVSTRHELGFEMNALQRRVEPWVMGRADAVLAVSQAVTDAIASRGCTVENVQVVEPTLSPWWYEDVPPFEGREKLIVSVGRLEYVKGHDLLLDAFSRLPRSLRAEWRVVIVGDGTRRGCLEQLAYLRGVAHQVTFAGDQHRAVVRDFLDRARVFALPSRSEGNSLALMEARARNCAVLVGGADLAHGLALACESGDRPTGDTRLAEARRGPSHGAAVLHAYFAA